jgi:hypothetical protein
MRALRTLKALQAEAAAELPVATPAHVHAQPRRSAARLPVNRCLEPNEPERRPVPHAERSLDYILPDAPAPGRALHEPAAPWMPTEPEGRPAPRLEYVLPDRSDPGHTLHEPASPWLPNEPEPATVLAPAPVFPVEGGERKRVVR